MPLVCSVVAGEMLPSAGKLCEDEVQCETIADWNLAVVELQWS
jgi:hypothetical protein